MGFKFSNQNTLSLDIEGKTYSIDPFGAEILEGTETFKKELMPFSPNESPDESTVLRQCGIVKKVVENWLGQGAYEAIFAGRKVNLLDHYELAIHIGAAIMAFREKRVADFIGNGAAKSVKEVFSDKSEEESLQ
jgi:hypothetical protein